MADASSCLPQTVFATNVMMHHAGLRIEPSGASFFSAETSSDLNVSKYSLQNTGMVWEEGEC